MADVSPTGKQELHMTGTITSLDDAKAKRSRLKATYADALARRAEAGAPVGALTTAEIEARNDAHKAAVAQWLHAGSKGSKPIPEDFTASASPALEAARQAVVAMLPALEALNAETADVRTKLNAAQEAVVDAASLRMADVFKALGERGKELRAELGSIEAELGSGFALFTEMSDHDYEATGRRNPALLTARETALAGFADERSSIRNIPQPSREQLVAARNNFEGLIS